METSVHQHGELKLYSVGDIEPVEFVTSSCSSRDKPLRGRRGGRGRRGEGEGRGGRGKEKRRVDGRGGERRRRMPPFQD